MKNMYIVNSTENTVRTTDYLSGVTHGVKDYNSVFYRKENAQHALALQNALNELVAKDREQHEADLVEARAYQDEQEQKKCMVLDIVTQGIGRHEINYDRKFLKTIGAILGIPLVRHGFIPTVVELTPGLALVQSDSDENKYYPVTKTACGCPDHVYRQRRACKHMRYLNDILGE